MLYCMTYFLRTRLAVIRIVDRYLPSYRDGNYPSMLVPCCERLKDIILKQCAHVPSKWEAKCKPTTYLIGARRYEASMIYMCTCTPKPCLCRSTTVQCNFFFIPSKPVVEVGRDLFSGVRTCVKRFMCAQTATLIKLLLCTAFLVDSFLQRRRMQN